MISKKSHLKFMVSHILRKEKMALRDMIVRIEENRKIYSQGGYEHMATRETIDGVELYITVIHDYSQNSGEILFCFDIRSKPPYPTRYWDNCTGDTVLEHLQEYLNNVIIRKKIII